MDSKEDFSTGIMKRPLEQEDDDSSMKRARGSGPKIELRILLQSKNAGAIIGKGGSNIKRLREHFKASVTVPDCTGPERILTIGADIDTALDCLADIIPSLEDYKQFSNDEYDCEIRILVHQSQAGCIIGRAGFKIKELREKTGANIKVYSTCCAQSTDRVVAISGRPPVVIACINVIYELLEMAPPKGVNQPYDPHNYDEYYAHDYGGYTIAEGGRGKLPRGAPPPPPRGGVSPLMSPQIRGRGTAGGMGDMGKITGSVEFTIGRKDCNLNIANDKTVSRKHAIITVDPVKIPYTKSSLTIRDVSSYGTYINRKKCDQNTAVPLKEGDKIMFGSPKSTFWVRFNPLVVTSSCLKNVAKSELDQVVKYFDGKVANEWCNKCSFLVMDYISVTVKVVCALAAQCQIVTIDYFKSLKAASEASLPCKGPEEFLPKLSPNFVIKNETFQPNPIRKTLFTGITFYFLKSPQWRKMKMAIELAGGHSCLCVSKTVDDSTLVEDTSVVMQTEPSEEEWISHVLSLLVSHSKRMIADAEIGQAILCCSTEKYCNPNVTCTKTFTQLQSQTMGFQSQQSVSTFPRDSSTFLNRSNALREAVKKPNPSTNTETTESPFLSSDASESKLSSTKRRRSPDKSENPFSAKEADNEPSNKKTRLFAEPVPNNTNPGSSVNREPSVQILAPESLSQVPCIKPQPILVIEDSDPEGVLSENEDQNSTNGKETTSDKLKQSNLGSTVIDCSENTEATLDTKIPTPVSVKKEAVDSTYEQKKNSKPFSLDLFSEDTQLNDKQEKKTENSTKFTDVFIKPGYLNTKFTTGNTMVKIKQEIKEEEDLPKSCAAVSFTNLVRRQPKPPPSREKTNSNDAPQGFVYYKGVLVHNFKKFRKNSNIGACSLPRIIGGNDLVVHNTNISKDLDDWFKEANEKESQENEETRRIEKLFNWEPNKKGYSKR